MAWYIFETTTKIQINCIHVYQSIMYEAIMRKLFCDIDESKFRMMGLHLFRIESFPIFFVFVLFSICTHSYFMDGRMLIKNFLVSMLLYLFCMQFFPHKYNLKSFEFQRVFDKNNLNAAFFHINANKRDPSPLVYCQLHYYLIRHFQHCCLVPVERTGNFCQNSFTYLTMWFDFSPSPRANTMDERLLIPPLSIGYNGNSYNGNRFHWKCLSWINWLARRPKIRWIIEQKRKIKSQNKNKCNSVCKHSARSHVFDCSGLLCIYICFLFL